MYTLFVTFKDGARQKFEYLECHGDHAYREHQRANHGKNKQFRGRPTESAKLITPLGKYEVPQHPPFFGGV